MTTTVAPAGSYRAGKLHMRPVNNGNRDSSYGENRYNILHVGKYYPPHMGGIEIYLQSLVRHQVQHCSVKVIVANDGIRTVRECMDGAELLRLSCMGSIKSMPICPALPWRLGRARADIVHMHMPNPAAAFAYIASGCQIPLVLTHHSDTMGRAKIRRLSEPFVQEAMRRASRIIVSSKKYADTSVELESHHDKIEVIPHGIDTAKHAVAEPGSSHENSKQVWAASCHRDREARSFQGIRDSDPGDAGGARESAAHRRRSTSQASRGGGERMRDLGAGLLHGEDR